MLRPMITKDRTAQPVEEQIRDERLPERAEPLAEVVAEIRADALFQPDAYIHQARVPADGE